MAGSAYFILNGGDNDSLGAALASAGNFDAGASGIQEFIIGSPGDTAVGATIYTGADSAGSSGILSDASNLTRITFTSDTIDDSTGSSVTGGFDFNGDGIGDVAITAPGKIFVIYGGSDALDADLTEEDLDGTAGIIISDASITTDSVLSSANLDGDSYDELVVGRPTGGTDAGSVVIFEFDGTNVTSVNGPVGEGGGDNLGFSLTALTDINDDGHQDFAIAAPGATGVNDTGKVYIVFGDGSTNTLDGLDLSTLNGATGFVVTGAANTDRAGFSVSDAGDFNSDGIADLILSAPQNDAGGNAAGEAYIIFGQDTGFSATIDLDTLSPTDGIKITGSAAGDQAGLSVIGVGDATGDTSDDVVVVGTDGSGNAVAYLINGGVGVTDIDLSTFGASDGYIFEGLGLGLFGDVPTATALGDVNNDGIADFALGAPEAGDVSNGLVIGILGGGDNLTALAGGDNTIDLADIADGTPPTVSFVATDETVSFGGVFVGAIDLRQDETDATNVISITDTDDTNATFDTEAGSVVEASGDYGDLTVVTDGTDERWTYILTGAALTSGLLFLGDGETVEDVVTLTASNGRQRDIVITITGEDDPTDVTLTPELAGFALTEDFASFSGTFSVDDPDQNDDPDLSGAILQSTNGRIEISADGTAFTYFSEADQQSLGFGQSTTEVFSGTFDGVTVTFELDVEGRDENTTGANATTEGAAYQLPGVGATVFFGDGDTAVTGTTGDDRIDTGAGDDIVDAGDGRDIVTDPFGNDTVTAGAGDDDVGLFSGTNTISDDSGTGSNYFKGGIGQDTITGGGGNDILDGDSVSVIVGASDRLDGAGGDDLLRGGLAADTFVFNPNDGNDTIADYDGTTYSVGGGYVGFGLDRDFTVGSDLIELSGFTTITTAQEALAAVSDVGGNATFDAEGTTITLQGVLTADLTVDEFVLV